MAVYEDFTAGIAIQSPRLDGSRLKKFNGMKGCQTALNVVLDELGVRTAPGYARNFESSLPAPVRGLHFYRRRGTVVVDQLLAVSGGNLYAAIANAWQSQATGLTDAAKTRMETFNGYALLVNGVDPVKQYDGATLANVAFTQTTAGTIPTNFRPSLMLVHRNTMFYAGDPAFPYRVFKPRIGTHDSFDETSDAFDVNIGDGQAVTGMASLTTGVAIIFKTESIHVMQGINATDATYEPITISTFSAELGCLSPDTIVSIGPDVYFLSQRGFKRLKYTAVTGNITDADPLHPAQPLLDAFDLTRASQANACFNAEERSIYLTFPITGGGFTTLVYNVVTQGIMQRDGFNTTNQIHVAPLEKHYFSRVEPSGSLNRVYQNGVGNTYDGVSFKSQWESLLLATDHMNDRKVYEKLLIYTRTFNGAQVQVGVRLVNTDGSKLTRLMDFGAPTEVDGWDIGKWDQAIWDFSIANVLRQNRVGRGVALSVFFNAAAGAAFFFDRVELDMETRGPARR